jgi:hypothetical protein
MKKLIKKLGVYNFTAVVIMVIGVVLWLLTPLLLRLWNFDSDIIGLMVFLVGLALFLGGRLRR